MGLKIFTLQRLYNVNWKFFILIIEIFVAQISFLPRSAYCSFNRRLFVHMRATCTLPKWFGRMCVSMCSPDHPSANRVFFNFQDMSIKFQFLIPISVPNIDIAVPPTLDGESLSDTISGSNTELLLLFLTFYNSPFIRHQTFSHHIKCE